MSLQNDRIQIKNKYIENQRKNKLEGKATLDMPWLQFYTNEQILTQLPNYSFYDMVYEYGKNHMNDVALIYPNAIGDKKWTYQELFSNIDQVAQAYLKLGVKPNSNHIVTIALPNIPEAVFSIYALTKLGVIVNMIHPLASVSEIKEILNLTKSKIFVTYEGKTDGENNIDKIHKIITHTSIQNVVVANPSDEMPQIMNYIYTKKSKRGREFNYSIDKKYIDWKTFIKVPDKKMASKVNPESTAFLLCTGGTTGTSKLVELTHNNVNCANATLKTDNTKCLSPGNEAIIIVLPLFHGFGLVNCLHYGLTSGITAVLMTKYTPEDYAKYDLKYNATLIIGVPAIFSGIVEHGGKLSFIDRKIIVYGGDKMSESLYNTISQFLIDKNSSVPLMGGYGMTEVVAAVTKAKKEVVGISVECDEKLEITNIGIPFPHNDVMIVKPQTRIEIEGYNKIGVICVAGPSVAKGYFKNKLETENTYFEYQGKRWVYTGDMGLIDSKTGCVFFAQREKRMIVTNGYNIFPSEVEAVLHPIKEMRTVVAIGIPDDIKGEKLVIYIELHSEFRNSKEAQVKNAVKLLCKEKLSKFAQPKDVVFVSEFPLTKMKKLDVEKLKTDYLTKIN